MADENVESDHNIILIVVIGLVLNMTIGVASLAFVLIRNLEVNVALLTAFVGVVNFIAGAVAGMLMKTRAQKTDGPPPEVKIADQPIATREDHP